MEEAKKKEKSKIRIRKIQVVQVVQVDSIKKNKTEGS